MPLAMSVFVISKTNYYIMPPIPPIPPMPPIPPIPPPPGNGSSFFGNSVITASAVVNNDATPAASVNAVLTTWNKQVYDIKSSKILHTLITLLRNIEHLGIKKSMGLLHAYKNFSLKIVNEWLKT